MSKLYTVGQAAIACGCSAARLYAYEAQGVIKPARAGSQRVFTEADLDAIRTHRKQLHQYNNITPPRAVSRRALAR